MRQQPVTAMYPPLIESLRVPQAYSHQVEEIRVLETHISWVLLTGEFAYKIKKPVNLGFLDFSTLELRRQSCEDEFYLNCRLIHDLYLSVVPITKLRNQSLVGGEGEPIEFAVKMRQFDQQDLANEMLKSGRLLESHVNQLAVTIAAFHQGAKRFSMKDVDINSSIHKPVKENFRQLRQNSNDKEFEVVLENLESWSLQQSKALSEIFISRIEEGFVRECHGDLHLRNLVHWDGEIRPFDCIEFSKSLRSVDVMSEIAFLVMDLDDHERPDLAHSFLNTYLEETGDYAGLIVLPFYCVYRAMVRAKVAAIRLSQDDLTEHESKEQLSQCQKYLQLAQRYTHSTTPSLSITYGLSGSGKTTGSQALIRRDGAIRIRSDVERKRLFSLTSEARTESGIGSGIYSPQATIQTFDRLASLAVTILKAGVSVIVDATFLKQSQRERFQKIAVEENVPFQIYSFHADESVLRERIRHRQLVNQDASDATMEVLNHQLKTMEPLTRIEMQFEVSSTQL